MNLTQPIRLSPAFKDYLWGGRRLIEDFNKNSDLDIVAESWELSTHPDGSSIICGGEFDGMAFRDFIEKYGKDVLGTTALQFDRFPVLIKFIDAKEKLSVQVHPDDTYALEKDGEYGKTEMWYVMASDEGSSLYYGFNRTITKAEFLERIEKNTLLEVLNKVPVKKGDVFFIEAGTVHAIGEGIMICEIQQNSNATYRVYDYDRRDKYGNPRDLHISKAADVSVLAPVEEKTPYADSETLAECKYFKVKKADIDGKRQFTAGTDSFVSVIVTEGTGVLAMNGTEIQLKPGDSIFIPAQASDFEINGRCQVILTRV